MTEDQEQPCLHCELMLTIEDYYEDQEGRGPDGRLVMDLDETLGSLAECVITVLSELREDARGAAMDHFKHALMSGLLRDTEITTGIQ
jgi:hypothetical protein